MSGQDSTYWNDVIIAAMTGVDSPNRGRGAPPKGFHNVDVLRALEVEKAQNWLAQNGRHETQKEIIDAFQRLARRGELNPEVGKLFNNSGRLYSSVSDGKRTLREFRHSISPNEESSQ